MLTISILHSRCSNHVRKSHPIIQSTTKVINELLHVNKIIFLQLHAPESSKSVCTVCIVFHSYRLIYSSSHTFGSQTACSTQIWTAEGSKSLDSGILQQFTHTGRASPRPSTRPCCTLQPEGNIPVSKMAFLPPQKDCVCMRVHKTAHWSALSQIRHEGSRAVWKCSAREGP